MGSTLPGKEFKIDLIPSDERLVSIHVNLGKWQTFDNVVKGIKLVAENANGKRSEATAGPCDGKWERPIEVPKGARLIGVSGNYGLVIDGLQFHFSDGTKSPLFGGERGDLDFQIAVKKSVAGPGRKGGQFPMIVRGLYGKASEDGFMGVGLILEGAGGSQ
jgi:hypothetical protein